ncbi:hypothetical protein AMCSP06_001222 [Streptococcus pneumoniae 2070768]|nr:hypothetical protein AMCSP06_001222 [Streptococcus pneumoniae 2070768]
MPEGKSKTVSRSPLFIFFYFKFFSKAKRKSSIKSSTFSRPIDKRI